MFSVKLTLLFSAIATLSAFQLNATPTTDLHIGHFGMLIDYELTPGNPDAGWDFSISYNLSNDFNTLDGTVRLNPADTTIIAAPDTEIVLFGTVPGIGSAGDTIWLLPQSNRPGQIFYGWRNVIDTGIFQQSNNGSFNPSGQGNIVVELIDASGPAIDAGGHFKMWESKSAGGVEIHYNTGDGLDADDRLEPVPIGQHSHYNYGLTQPGNYEITFRVSGRLNPWQPDGNSDTSGTDTFKFAVPFSSVASGEAELRLALTEDPGPAAIYPYGETVEYAPGQVSLVTQSTDIGGIIRPYAFAVDVVVSTASPAPHRVGLAGTQPIAFPAGIGLAGNPLEIIGTSGPGSLQLVTDSASSSDRRYFVFSAPGIYRVQLRAVGSDGATATNGPAFELTFLAGLQADYDFAEYADSFERSHGLAAGSLQDDGSDWDGDGIPDVIEFQLFWDGLDPAVADAAKLPLPDPSDPEGLIVFHRDTYKDRLNRYTQNIVLEYSTDLSDWQGWSDRTKGFPLGQYETGAERGNAYARIQRRTLRLPTITPEHGFFRWRIDPSN